MSGDSDQPETPAGSPSEGENKEYAILEPDVLNWEREHVRDWIKSCGYDIYQDCFYSNFISGRRLVMMTASQLPNIGIYDFNHILDITRRIRELLQIKSTPWDRSISLPPQEILHSYLEYKSKTGQIVNKVKYEDWRESYPNTKFQPPLGNHGLLLAEFKTQDLSKGALETGVS